MRKVYIILIADTSLQKAHLKKVDLTMVTAAYLSDVAVVCRTCTLSAEYDDGRAFCMLVEI